MPTDRPAWLAWKHCSSAHYRARKLEALGHTVRLIESKCVKPYVKSNKNDAADAEAICEAVTRPTMRFMPIKNVELQSILACIVLVRGFVKARTAQANQIRGLLGEFGLIMPQGVAHITTRLPSVIEGAANELPASFRQLIERLIEHFKVLDKEFDELEAQIKAWHRADEISRQLERIPGIGPLTGSALVASIGDARSFKKGGNWLPG